MPAASFADRAQAESRARSATRAFRSSCFSWTKSECDLWGQQVVEMTGAGAPEAPTQSPVVITGLHRIATSLWLHFVASPQRMPVSRYRRGDRPVVNLIYRVPPPSSIATTSALPRRHGLGGYPAALRSKPDSTRRCRTYESRSAN